VPLAQVLQVVKIVMLVMVYSMVSVLFALKELIFKEIPAEVKVFFKDKLIVYKACPSKCETCTSGTVCQSCESGFTLTNDLCTPCTGSQYYDGTTCQSKLF